MAAIVTDQFRILNANNFVDSVESTDNSYYVFVGLSNPRAVGYGRTDNWDKSTPAPIDTFSNNKHTGDTMMFGKKITAANIRRIIRKVEWVSGTRYEMYRDDYSITNPSPLTRASRLYQTNYYVMNSDFRVYICVENGSSGETPLGNVSQDEPTFTDLEPSRAGDSGDGYIWKYLFTVSPSDIIKFDSTEYLTVPNNWNSSTDTQIRSVRENGNSNINENQIKTVYIEKSGDNYANGLGQEVDILGDGTGGKVRIDVISNKITDTTVTAGGKDYSYGIVDLGSLNSNVPANNMAKLVPIIPPSLGHGYDAYTELGTDKVLIYARFDDSTKDFPTDTKFAQVGIVKNPTGYGGTSVYAENTFSSTASVKLTSVSGTPVVGEKITQTVTGGQATGYVASYDNETQVLKYYKDRSLYLNNTTSDNTDYAGISTSGKIYQFEATANQINGAGGFSGAVDTAFTGISTNPTGTKIINLGVSFTDGLASPEINKGSGEIIYLDNRPQISRNSRQKEDVKIILEF